MPEHQPFSYANEHAPYEQFPPFTTKQQEEIEELAHGLSWKAPVAYATATVLPAIVATATTLTSVGKEALEVDGAAPTVGQRILVKNQVLSQNDGVFSVTKAGAAGTELFVLTRTADASTTAQLQDAAIFAEKGTANAGHGFVQTGTVTVVGTTAQTWVLFSSAGSYTAKAPLKLVGSEFEIEVDGITEGLIGPEAIDEDSIKAEAVSAGKIATGAITETKLGALAITAAKIGAEAIETAKIKLLAVTTGTLAEEAVTAIKIATGAVTETKLGALAVTGAKIAKETITGEKLALETVEAAQIKKETITGAKLVLETIETAQIKKEQVAANRLKNGEIETTQVKEKGLTANRLKNSEIATEQIKAEGIKNASIEKETLTGEKLANATVGGKQIKVGTPEALKELKENTSIEPSATEAVTVSLSVLAKAEETVGEVIVDGKSCFMIRKETLAASSDNIYFSFGLKAAGKFEVKMTTGKIETATTEKSVYTFQTG
jgi:hypothetical protein